MSTTRLDWRVGSDEIRYAFGILDNKFWPWILVESWIGDNVLLSKKYCGKFWGIELYRQVLHYYSNHFLSRSPICARNEHSSGRKPINVTLLRCRKNWPWFFFHLQPIKNGQTNQVILPIKSISTETGILRDTVLSIRLPNPASPPSNERPTSIRKILLKRDARIRGRAGLSRCAAITGLIGVVAPVHHHISRYRVCSLGSGGYDSFSADFWKTVESGVVIIRVESVALTCVRFGKGEIALDSWYWCSRVVYGTCDRALNVGCRGRKKKCVV